MTRDAMLRRLEGRQEWDVVIIGGGATGAGVAVDAASRGYSVLLLEQHDFGNGTSSRSTKLVHGGVRYLEHGNISLVMEALKERGILRQNAPHLVSNLPFVVPNYENRNPAPKYQLPFTAEESMKFIQLPAEFKLELFAKEPDIIEPIAFNFDERGRLWIIEAIDYPNVVLAGKPGDDRIKIVEDTNGDGRADKFTVFAEHLNLPTSLVFANGGVDAVHVNGNVITVDLSKGGSADGLADLIRELFIYYREPSEPVVSGGE